MLKYKIEVEIDNINVIEKYFNFDYKVTIDNTVLKEEEYFDTHSWDENLAQFKHLLEIGHALSLVLEHIEI